MGDFRNALTGAIAGIINANLVLCGFGNSGEMERRSKPMATGRGGLDTATAKGGNQALPQ